MDDSQRRRADVFAALADPIRVAVVDELACCDRTPAELRHHLCIESNLLAHHLDVLERHGLIARSTSSGDRRRRYVQLRDEAFDALLPTRPTVADAPLFVCTRNSARSQLAATLWTTATGESAESAGTEPADEIHPGARAAARRARAPIARTVRPRSIDELDTMPAVIITVCDQAHEHLDADGRWLHWSIPDPVPAGTDAAFDATVDELRRRIGAMTGAAS